MKTWKKNLNKIWPALVVGMIVAACQPQKPPSTPDSDQVTNPVIRYRSGDPGPVVTSQPRDQAGWEIIDLKDLSGGQGVGRAWRLDDGQKFIHKVFAEKLAQLPPGYFYAGWLVKGDPQAGYGFISTGRMKAGEEPGVYNLYFESTSAYAEYVEAVVTREAVDDGQPETWVMAGSFGSKS